MFSGFLMNMDARLGKAARRETYHALSYHRLVKPAAQFTLLSWRVGNLAERVVDNFRQIEAAKCRKWGGSWLARRPLKIVPPFLRVGLLGVDTGPVEGATYLSLLTCSQRYQGDGKQV